MAISIGKDDDKPLSTNITHWLLAIKSPILRLGGNNKKVTVASVASVPSPRRQVEEFVQANKNTRPKTKSELFQEGLRKWENFKELKL